MKSWGIIAVLLGLAIAIGSMFYDTSVATASDAISGYGSMPAEVYNLGRLQQQMMLFVSGIALLVVGIVLAAVGSAVEQLRHTVSASDQPTTLPITETQASPDPASPREMSASERAEIDRAGNVIIWFVVGAVVLLFTAAALAFALIPHSY